MGTACWPTCCACWRLQPTAAAGNQAAPQVPWGMPPGPRAQLPNCRCRVLAPYSCGGDQWKQDMSTGWPASGSSPRSPPPPPRLAVVCSASLNKCSHAFKCVRARSTHPGRISFARMALTPLPMPMPMPTGAAAPPAAEGRHYRRAASAAACKGPPCCKLLLSLLSALTVLLPALLPPLPPLLCSAPLVRGGISSSTWRTSATPAAATAPPAAAAASGAACAPPA